MHRPLMYLQVRPIQSLACINHLTNSIHHPFNLLHAPPSLPLACINCLSVQYDNGVSQNEFMMTLKKKNFK